MGSNCVLLVVDVLFSYSFRNKRDLCNLIFKNFLLTKIFVVLKFYSFRSIWFWMKIKSKLSDKTYVYYMEKIDGLFRVEKFCRQNYLKA